ncbi:hypothetical protein D3C78_1911210 [compost metagenome]
MAMKPALSLPISTGRMMVGWKLAVNERWSPSRKAAQTPKAMLITLSFGGM